jgi:hypothetical protein
MTLAANFGRSLILPTGRPDGPIALEVRSI